MSYHCLNSLAYLVNSQTFIQDFLKNYKGSFILEKVFKKRILYQKSSIHYNLCPIIKKLRKCTTVIIYIYSHGNFLAHLIDINYSNCQILKVVKKSRFSEKEILEMLNKFRYLS